jgi:glycosyltransferase involved in cell wall biosynthesis
VIPYGVDHTTFRPKNTKNLRQKLGIPEAHDVILFVAQSTKNRRKGFRFLVGSLNKINVEGITLVSVGSNEPSIPGSMPHIHAGQIESDVKLAEFYSMASIFVIPSRQDNLPNTVLESMACGTPVVGFDAGGIPDMVRPSETGWLAEAGSVQRMRDAIEAALANEKERKRKATRCREVVEEEYTLKHQADRYKEVYQSIL